MSSKEPAYKLHWKSFDWKFALNRVDLENCIKSDKLEMVLRTISVHERLSHWWSYREMYNFLERMFRWRGIYIVEVAANKYLVWRSWYKFLGMVNDMIQEKLKVFDGWLCNFGQNFNLSCKIIRQTW